jgi:hypothetical protein
MEKCSSSFRVCRVSSARMRLTPCKIRIARKLMSSKLPMGVPCSKGSRYHHMGIQKRAGEHTGVAGIESVHTHWPEGSCCFGRVIFPRLPARTRTAGREGLADTSVAFILD